MDPRSALPVVWLYCMLPCGLAAGAQPHRWEELAAPEVEGPWARPPSRREAQPVWGHANGLRVGLAPMPGPRGLLRIYAPYLGHPPGRMINFIAVEPILAGQERRGFSELEPSRLDGMRGKRFWFGVEPEKTQPPSAPGS